MKKILYLDKWRISEPKFSENFLGKFESIMALGNGYLGLRNSHEESYINEKRNMFVAGVFDRFSNSEVTELATIPDISKINIWIDNERFSLLAGNILQYERTFNYRTGESFRNFIWENSKGNKFEFTFKKFVSMTNKHLVVTHLYLKNLGKKANVKIESGIDGTVNNTGSQHFEEGDKRYFANKFLYMSSKTIQSNITVAIACRNKLECKHITKAAMDRRQIYEGKEAILEEDKHISFTKYSLIKSSRDLERNTSTYLEKDLIDELMRVSLQSYDELLNDSIFEWNNLWQKKQIEISSTNFTDELLLNFARYHMHIMAPIHDNRLNIGAKGFTGEGYKGHTFWDTEIFILPYFIYMYPEWAKSLVEYRLNGLTAAKNNAQINGFEGAQYPWESAHLSDGEVTPNFGEIDIVSGKPTPVLTGKLEHHVTGDVVFGAQELVDALDDKQFKEKISNLIIEAAIFWASRATFNKKKDRYEIHDVIGPDEYKEHVNNNAYTNYLAKFTMEKALEQVLEGENDQKNILKEKLDEIRNVYEKLYLPEINDKKILPQDDTYLDKEIIDLDKYHNDERVGTIFQDYNLEQLNRIQVSKQADVILLMLLFPLKFDKETKIANWNYYYPKTLHDSSLSLCSHCNFALMIDKIDLAYDLFRKSFEIDLGDNNMDSSSTGIHAASMGGIWQNVVKGFGGFSVTNGIISLKPKLPIEWKELKYSISALGAQLDIQINKSKISVEVLHGEISRILINDREVTISKSLEVYY